ncbi:Glycosyltransferase Gtf1 [bioreactor metagenome]|uniref:Glycosyltransferase Gtf1 n=1 Tax=bioreactor metagenome TaxID=1076179 RepID=A0A645AZZ3_9ZZZZ
MVAKKLVKTAGSCKIIFISRIVPKKNLTFALNVLKNVKGEITFDIYGAKEDLDYWKKCERLIDNLPPNITVTYCGLAPHQEVNSIFQRYDVLLFPTHSENYGHVIIESLLAGCPVIISDQTPWNDVNATGAGWAIPLNKPSDFSNALQKVIDADSDRYRVNAKLFVNKKLNLDALKKDYEAVFIKIRNR